MYIKPTYILEKLYPSAIWRMLDHKNTVFLSFDDGPHPEITPKVLDLLDKYNAKATFFCLGRNVERYPETYNEIIRRGHKTGNHTYSHIKGWAADKESYLADIELAATFIESNLFRPPYGKISTKQLWALKKKYKIFMWDVLTMDYSKNISPSHCLANVISKTRPGSIVVFHDSEKAEKNMFFALQNSLEYFCEKKYQLESLY